MPRAGYSLPDFCNGSCLALDSCNGHSQAAAAKAIKMSEAACTMFMNA